MKRYLITEHDLQRLEDLALDYAESKDQINRIQLFQARKAARAIEVPERGDDQVARILGAANALATHIEGLLELGAIGTPENTRHWLQEFRNAQSSVHLRRTGDVQ